MGAWGIRVDWACVVCGKAMHTRPSQVGITCSKACAGKLHAPRLTAPRINCPTCGKEFASRMCGGARMKYCSRRCADRRSAAKSQAKRLAKAVRAIVRAEIAALFRIAKYKEKPATWRKRCARCGNDYVVRRTKGHPKGACNCPVPLTSAARKARRVAKSMRRAAIRSRKRERIDPIEILARDKWRCRICGIDTPKGLRGTIEHNAPELDHIVPLAKGGSHTKGNVQCLCRSCNHFKSDSLMHEVEQRLAA